MSAILNAVFSIQFLDVEFRKAEPQKYKLLQVSDFICYMEGEGTFVSVLNGKAAYDWNKKCQVMEGKFIKRSEGK